MWRLRHAVRLLRAGRLVAHPTEGVWGLACDPLLPEAVLRVLAAKRRDPAKGLILVTHDAAVLTPFLDAAPDQLERARADWPGPVTWVLPAAPQVPWWLTGDHDSLAVRVTAHPVAAALCRAFGGPLVSTSANLAGHAAPRHAWQARAQVGAAVDLFLAGDLDTPGRPSTIRDGRTGDVIRD
ncbi:putative translation factor [Salinisphaera sp. PC39]|uniref:L-threonylcarbamoyladenylate synthase n=1 Tax=Salinisphaera sp. PC39 TaxID=1304156 RepID=UPI0033405C27